MKRKGLSLGVPVVSKHVSAAIENYPNRPYSLGGIRNRDLIAAICGNVFLGLGSDRRLKNDTLRSGI